MNIEPDDLENSEFDFDDLKAFTGRLVLHEIVPILAREAEPPENRKFFAEDVAFALISGTFLRLVRQHHKEFEAFFLQAVDRAKQFALDDLRQYPDDYLAQRHDRWVDLLRQPPRAVHRRSPETGAKTISKLQALLLFEQAREFASTWRGKDANSIRDALRDDVNFGGLTAAEREEIAEMIADGTMRDQDIAMELSAKEVGIRPDSFERHYLRGSRKLAEEIDRALKIK